ncbi:PRTRC system ThiF family protein [Vibrio sp. PNB22_3_1]
MFDNQTFTDERLLKHNISIHLVGCGGTGSFLCSEIINLINAVTMLSPETEFVVKLFDPANVTEANLVRQQFFKTQLGMNKATALAWTANNLYGMNFIAIESEYNPDQYTTPDILITALDKPSTRYAIYKKHLNKRNATYWLDTGNAEQDGNIILGELGLTQDRARLPTVCDMFDYSVLSDDEGNTKSCSAMESLSKQRLGVNAMSARLGGQLLFNLVIDGKLENNGAIFDIKTLHTTPLEIHSEEWSILLGDDYEQRDINRQKRYLAEKEQERKARVDSQIA